MGDDEQWDSDEGSQQTQPQRQPGSTIHVNQTTASMSRSNDRGNGNGRSRPMPKFGAPVAKKKANGYLMYANHRRNAFEKETGTKMMDTLPEILTRFDADWRSLPEADRMYWKNKAKDMCGKTGPQPQPGDGLWKPRVMNAPITPNPRPPAPRSEPPKEPEMGVEIMTPLEPLSISFLDSEITNAKQYLEASSVPLIEKSFVVINFNNYYIDNVNPFIPAEIGYAVFSLKDGITFSETCLIDPGIPELRSCTETKTVIDKTGLPRPVFEKEEDEALVPLLTSCGTKNFGAVLQKLVDTLQKTNKDEKDFRLKTVCFTYQDQENVVSGTTKWLARAADTNDRRFKVFTMDSLVLELLNIRNIDTQGLRYELESGLFVKNMDLIYNPLLACKWHQQDNLHELMKECAMHKTFRLIYLTLALVLPNYNMDILPDVHLPPVFVKKLQKNFRHPFLLTEEDEDIRAEALQEYQQLATASDRKNYNIEMDELKTAVTSCIKRKPNPALDADDSDDSVCSTSTGLGGLSGFRLRIKKSMANMSK